MKELPTEEKILNKYQKDSIYKFRSNKSTKAYMYIFNSMLTDDFEPISNYYNTLLIKLKKNVVEAYDLEDIEESKTMLKLRKESLEAIMNNLYKRQQNTEKKIEEKKSLGFSNKEIKITEKELLINNTHYVDDFDVIFNFLISNT